MPLVRSSISLLIFFTLLLGFVYPLGVMGISYILFPNQAKGSLAVDHDRIIGSPLIGQDFQSDRYFHPRPSAAGKGYDPMNSGGSNLSQTNKAWIETLKSRVQTIRKENGYPSQPIPVDLITASGSGLDPQESVASAYYQANRIARVRHLSEAQVRQLINSHIHPRTLGFLGEPTVNVLELNRALDAII